MRMPSHTTLCSFVFSLLLTSAVIPSPGNVSLAAAGAPAAQMAAQTVLNGLRAQGFAGGADLALPSPATTPSAAATSASAPAPTLTPAVLDKILRLIAEKGDDRELPPQYANPLGLTSSGQTWASRSLTYDEASGARHGFYISRGADQDILITVSVPNDALYAYRAMRDGTAMGGIVIHAQTKQLSVLSAGDAQSALDAQVAFWTRRVEPKTGSN